MEQISTFKEPKERYRDIEGVVERITLTGIEMNGVWYNRSHFALVSDYEKVGVGDTIKIRIDSSEYIVKLKIVSVADF